MWGLAEFCLLSGLLVMPGYSVKVSPPQLVELLWSKYTGDKHSVYLQHILACNRSDSFFVTIQKRKKKGGEKVQENQ